MNTIADLFSRCRIGQSSPSKLSRELLTCPKNTCELLDFLVSWTSRGPSLKTAYNGRTERTKEINHVFKMTESKRSKLYTGFLGVAALTLFAACADDTAPEEEPAEDPAVQEDPAQDRSEEHTSELQSRGQL